MEGSTNTAASPKALRPLLLSEPLTSPRTLYRPYTPHNLAPKKPSEPLEAQSQAALSHEAKELELNSLTRT